MDLGIRGRTAIVCASSQGLGRACAQALGEAGVILVINGRNRSLLEQTAAEIRHTTGAKVTPVVADVSTSDGQAALLEACPAPDILINNNGGPPLRSFLDLSRQALLDGLSRHLGDNIEVAPSTGGMHLVVWFRRLGYPNLRRLVARAAERGLGLYPIHPYYQAVPPKPGLMVGFAGLSPEQLDAATALLADCLKDVTGREAMLN